MDLDQPPLELPRVGGGDEEHSPFSSIPAASQHVDDRQEPPMAVSSAAAVADSAVANAGHMLPCNIEFQGMAATHTFFRPTELVNEDGEFYASSFRGRGLLVKKPPATTTLNKDPQTNDDDDDDDDASVSARRRSHAVLLSLSHHQNKVQVKANIDTLLEWQHESNTGTLEFAAAKSRVQTASEWCRVAKALHDPIPVVDDEA